MLVVVASFNQKETNDWTTSLAWASREPNAASALALGHSVASDPYRCSQKRAVASHDLAVEQYELARRMSGDGFGNAADGDGEEIGRAADRDAVIADAQCPRASGADQLEGDLHLFVAAEI